MTDQAKCIALGTVGEFQMLNITMPGLDLKSLGPEQIIRLKWAGGIQILLRQLSKWGVEEEGQARMLGTTCESIKAWQSREDAPVTDDVVDRCRSLFRIHMALRVIFPIRPNTDDYGNHWLHASNQHFKKMSPLNYMVENGPTEVKRYLFAAMQH